MYQKHKVYHVCVYVGGLSSVHAKEIFKSSNKKSAYAKLEEYLAENPMCVKAYIDEIYE